MRFTVLALVLASLWPAADVARSFELGPRAGVSIPTGELSDFYDPGFYVGVSLTSRKDSWIGAGLDVGYHHWPGSGSPESQFAFPAGQTGRARLQHLLSTNALNATICLNVRPLPEKPVTTWARFGLGAYRVSTEVVAPDTRSFHAGLQERLGIVHGEVMAGLEGSVGMDFRLSAATRFGLEARYHRLIESGNPSPPFSALALGARVMFGEP